MVFPVIKMFRPQKQQKYTDDTHLTRHKEYSQTDKNLDCILQWMDLSPSKCKNLVNKENSFNEVNVFVLIRLRWQWRFVCLRFVNKCRVLDSVTVLSLSSPDYLSISINQAPIFS